MKILFINYLPVFTCLVKEFTKFSGLLAEHSYVRLGESKARLFSFCHYVCVCAIVRTKRAETATYNRYLTIMVRCGEKDNFETAILLK